MTSWLCIDNTYKHQNDNISWLNGLTLKLLRLGGGADGLDG
jgi:hypothetical protein